MEYNFTSPLTSSLT